MMEEWREIPDYPGYEISSLGNARSFRSGNGKGELKSEARVLKQQVFAGRKYYRLTLFRNGKPKTLKTHRVMLEAFKGPCPPGMQGLHRDDNQSNNTIDNLMWGTHAENVADKIANGKQVRGSGVGIAKLSEAQAGEIKQRLIDAKRGIVGILANEYGVCRSSISAIKHDHTWRHV